jgi:hypothetical protein
MTEKNRGIEEVHPVFSRSSVIPHRSFLKGLSTRKRPSQGAGPLYKTADGLAIVSFP